MALQEVRWLRNTTAGILGFAANFNKYRKIKRGTAEGRPSIMTTVRRAQIACVSTYRPSYLGMQGIILTHGH